MEESRRGWLGFAWYAGFAPNTLREIRRYAQNDGMRGFMLSCAQLRSLGVTEKATREFHEWRVAQTSDDLERRCTEARMRFVSIDDDEYPELLREIYDPPIGLFVRGAPIPRERVVAVVGTRSMTMNGKNATHLIVDGFVRAGCVVVSGLALGVDGHAHETALDAGGITCAVLPSSCDDGWIYPRAHTGLAKRILDHDGTVISEYPPGMGAHRHHCILRNRIIAGISSATVVVEAAEKSGSLITAGFALDANRDVFAVPGLINSPQSKGTHRLLKRGAFLCTDAEDVCEALEWPVQQLARIPPNASPLAKRILAILKEPLHFDKIIQQLNTTDSAHVSAELTMLELQGAIHHQGAQVFERKA